MKITYFHQAMFERFNRSSLITGSALRDSSPVSLGRGRVALSLFVYLFAQMTLTAEIDLGNKGALALGLDTRLEHNSNIILDSTEESDFIAIAQPKILYRYNEGSVLVDAFIGVEFHEYDQASEYDSDSIKSGFSIDYPYGGRSENYELKFSGGYNETTSADPRLQAVVAREVLDLNLIGRYFFTERYSVLSGVRYRDRDTLTAGFNDVETIILPVDFFYSYSEALRFGAGYRFRETNVSGVPMPASSKDHALYLVVEGRISPSVDAEIRVGAQKRDFEEKAYNGSDSFFFESALEWNASSQSVVELRAGQEFDTSAANNSVETKYIDLGYKHKFDEKISMNAKIGYKQDEYTRLTTGGQFQTNDEVYAELGGQYVLIENRLVLNALVRHSDQTSDNVRAEYDQTLARLGLSFIY